MVKQQFDVVSVRPGPERRTNDQRTTIDYFDIGTTTVTIPPAARAALGM
jgi:hypothetical protein